MPRISFTIQELQQVLLACEDYAFLGDLEFEVDGWTDKQARTLRLKILDKINLGMRTQVKERQYPQWTDEDTPQGEFASGYSPLILEAA